MVAFLNGGKQWVESQDTQSMPRAWVNELSQKMRQAPRANLLKTNFRNWRKNHRKGWNNMADFDKSKFDPKAAAEARKQEMDQMAQKLEAGVKDVFQGENYKAYLDFCAKMPRYSINNQILIMMQKPDATMCQSFTGWKEMGRFVKKITSRIVDE